MADLVCRACRRHLIDEAGCAICLGVKPHLMPVDAADEDAVPLAQLAGETAGLLRRQLQQLKVEQKKSLSYTPGLADESRKHANALAKLLDASRKVIQDGADAVDAMSFQEKAALFLEWFSTLPPAYRRRLHDQMSGRVEPTQPEPGELPDDRDRN